jgi:hypothetical protein
VSGLTGSTAGVEAISSLSGVGVLIDDPASPKSWGAGANVVTASADVGAGVLAFGLTVASIVAGGTAGGGVVEASVQQQHD